MSFVSTDPHTHQGENTWFTPPEIDLKREYLRRANSWLKDNC